MGVAYLAFVATATRDIPRRAFAGGGADRAGTAGTVARSSATRPQCSGGRRLIASALIASMVCACLLGLVGPSSSVLAASLLLL